MSTIIDISALTLNAREAESVSEIIAERFFDHPQLNTQHRVETGIEMKEQILLAGLYGKHGKKLTGCKPPEDAGTLPFSEKFWDPQDWGFRKNHCATEVNKLFKVFRRRLKRGEYDDLQGTDEMLFIIDRIMGAMTDDFHRLIWFGDVNMDVVGSGGYLADALAAEVPYWTLLDGLWQQIFDGVTATTVKRHTIAKNGEATEALQRAVPAGFALEIFRGLFSEADVRLRNAPDKKIFITDSIWVEWQEYLEDKALAFSLAEVQDGISAVKFRGAEIIVRDDWDRHIAEFDDLTVIDKPHRAVMTTPDNIPVGTMDEESLTEVKSWYSDDDDVNYLQVKSRWDVKLIEDYMCVCAY